MSNDAVFEVATSASSNAALAKEIQALPWTRSSGLLIQVLASPENLAALDPSAIERELSSQATTILVETVPTSLLPDWPSAPTFLLRCRALAAGVVNDRRAWLDSLQPSVPAAPEVLSEDGEPTDLQNEAILTDVQGVRTVTQLLRWRITRNGKVRAQGAWSIPSAGLTFGLTGGAAPPPLTVTLDGPGGPLAREETTAFKNGRRVGRFSRKQFHITADDEGPTVLTVLGKAPMSLCDPVQRSHSRITTDPIAVPVGAFWVMTLGELQLEFMTDASP